MQRVLGLDSDVDAMMICVDEPLRLVGGGKRRDIAQVEARKSGVFGKKWMDFVGGVLFFKRLSIVR